MDMAAGDPQELDFRSFLQNELEKRCKKNPRFSLRAFARTLEVEPSALSKILHGKRALTPKMLMRMASQLGLPTQDIERFASQQERISPKDSYKSKNDASKMRVHKKAELALSSESLKKAEILLETLFFELKTLGESSLNKEASLQEDIFSIEIMLRSEQINIDPDF